MFFPSQKLKYQDLPKSEFWWGVLFLPSQKSKCQDLPKSEFSRGGAFLPSQKSKCQDLPKSEFSGGGGGGVFLPSQKSKCQDLPKSEFFWGGGVFLPSQKPKCQDLSKYEFSGGGCSCQVKSQSAKIWPTFHFQGGGRCSVPNPRTGCSCQFDQKFCLTSHILRMRRLMKLLSDNGTETE